LFNIGVKYCGGCNPKYDRKEFLYKLQKDCKCSFETAREGKLYDFIIVLCGCSSCCADCRRLKWKFEKILVDSESDFRKIKEVFDVHSDRR
jgi:4-hydroxybutyrate CoA-transferase